MKNHVVPASVLVLALLAALAPLALAMAAQATPGATPARPKEPVDLGCTIWRTSAKSPTTPKGCSYSDPWWLSFSCPVTPIHSEPWPGAKGDVLGVIPWIALEPADLGIVAHLWFGNAPLPVGGQTPDGTTNAKVLFSTASDWQPVALSAKNLDDPSQVLAREEMGAANAPLYGSQWPTIIRVPTPGCWQFAVEVADVRRQQTREAHFVLVAVK